MSTLEKPQILVQTSSYTVTTSNKNILLIGMQTMCLLPMSLILVTSTNKHQLTQHTHARTHARTHACTHAHTHTHAHAHTHTHTHTHTHAGALTRTHTHRHMHMHVHTSHKCLHMRTHTRTHTHTYAHTHTHTHTHMYGMGHKKVPVFRNTLTCNGKFAFVFASVPFYNFPCFYCCVSILKAQCKER